MKNLIAVALLLFMATTTIDAQIVNRFRDSTVFFNKVQFDSNIRITQGASNGKVLTSDANGFATWQAGGGGWGLTGNSGTNPATNFVGTTDNQDLKIKRNSITAINIESYADIGTSVYRVSIIDTNENNLITAESFDGTRIRVGMGDMSGNFNATKISVDDDAQTVTCDGSIKIVDGTQANGYVLTSDAGGLASWQALSASDYTGIPAYPDNATAVGVLGAGKLYYTDVAGEYIVKLTH